MPQYRVMCIMVGFFAGFGKANRILQRRNANFPSNRKIQRLDRGKKWTPTEAEGRGGWRFHEWIEVKNQQLHFDSQRSV